MRGKYLFPQSQYIPLTKRGLMGLKNPAITKQIAHLPSSDDINFIYEISTDATLAANAKDPKAGKILAYADTALKLLGQVAGLSIVGIKTAAVLTGTVMPIVGAAIFVASLLIASGIFDSCDSATYNDQDGEKNQIKIDNLLKPHFEDLARQTPVTASQDDKVFTKLNEIASIICYLEMFWHRERHKTDWNRCSRKNIDLLKDKVAHLKDFFLRKLRTYQQIYEIEIVNVNVDLKKLTYRGVSMINYTDTGYSIPNDGNWDLIIIYNLGRKPEHLDTIVPFFDFADMQNGDVPKLFTALQEPHITKIKKAGKKLKDEWQGYEITLENGVILDARPYTPEEWDGVARDNLGNSGGGVVVTPPASTTANDLNIDKLKRAMQRYYISGYAMFEELRQEAEKGYSDQVLFNIMKEHNKDGFQWLYKKYEWACYIKHKRPQLYQMVIANATQSPDYINNDYQKGLIQDPCNIPNIKNRTGLKDRILNGSPAPSPTVQPSRPTVQPSTPTVQPSTPTVQPSTPAVQPSTPTVQPSTPAVQPSTPTVPGTSTETENISVTEQKSGFPWWVLLLLAGGIYMGTKKDKKSKKVKNE